MKKYSPGRQRPEYAAESRLVAPGEGHQEIVARRPTRAMATKFRKFASERQRKIKQLSAKRAREVEAGLIHETPAMIESKRKYGPW